MRTYLRRGRAAALVIAPLLVLAACGGDDASDADGDNGGSGEEAPEPSDEPVHLTISHNATRPQVEAVWIEDYVIPEFEALMADQGREVTVEHIEGGVDDYKTQLALDLSVGEGPDITSFDQFWTAEFAAAGLIEPLRTLVGDQIDEWEGWDQIPDAVVGSLAVDDEPYGLPLGTDGRVIFFRTDLFEQAGLPTDWQPTSWEEILDAARTLQSELPDVTPMQLNAGISMEEATTLQGFIPILLGAGGEVHADGMWQGDTPELRSTLEFYDTVYGEGLADSDMQLLTDGRDRSFEGFSEGNIGMMIESDYLWRGVINPEGNFPLEGREDVVGWAMIPAQEPGAGIRGQDFVSASGGTGRVINPNTEHPYEAWELLSWMSSYEAQLDYVEREPRITAREDVNEAGIADDAMLTFVAEEVLPITWYRPGFEEYPQVSEAIQFMVENVVSGRSDIEAAAQEFHSTLEGIVGPDNVNGG